MTVHRRKILFLDDVFLRHRRNLPRKVNPAVKHHAPAFPVGQADRFCFVLISADAGPNAGDYANTLAVQMIENYGQVRVTDQAKGKALAKTYVKVYGKLANGQVRFYKDGYTDLRGRFDYVSLNTGELDNVQSFSILILNDDHGAIIREAKPPKQ